MSHPSCEDDLLDALGFNISFYPVLIWSNNTQRTDVKLNTQVFVKALKARMKEVRINIKYKWLENRECI